MAEAKTKLNANSVAEFLDAIPNEQVRQDCWTLVNLMQTATQAPPQMWGEKIVGFSSAPVIYASGRIEDWPLISFSPRKENITLYNLLGSDHDEELLTKLGKNTRGKGCLYIKRLSDIDLSTLQQMIQAAVAHRRATGDSC